MADDLAARLATMHWNILTAATPSLLTGDNPVLVFEPGKARHTGPDILPDTAELHMPLSPTHLLVVSPYPALGAGTADAQPDARLGRVVRVYQRARIGTKAFVVWLGSGTGVCHERGGRVSR